MYQSMKGTKKSYETLLQGISENCRSYLNLSRSPSALKERWCSLRRVVTTSLAVKDLVTKGRNSGRTEETLLEMVITMYKERLG